MGERICTECIHSGVCGINESLSSLMTGEVTGAVFAAFPEGKVSDNNPPCMELCLHDMRAAAAQHCALFSFK